MAPVNSPFPPPQDEETKTIIDKLANFVARNGSKFEEMTKEKQKDNPKFGFLFGGESFKYYKWRVSYEIAQMHSQHAPQEQYPQASLVQQAIVQQSINSAPWQQAAQAQQAQQMSQQPVPQQQQQQQQQLTYPQPPPGLDVTDFSGILQKILESATKDNVSNGKNWIFNNAKDDSHFQYIANFLMLRVFTPGMVFQHKLHIIYLVNDLLHHAARKQTQEVSSALRDIIIPIYCATFNGESAENQKKLLKVLGIWETNNFFDSQIITQLKNPESAQSVVQAAQNHALQQMYYSGYNAPADPQPQHYNQYPQYYPSSSQAATTASEGDVSKPKKESSIKTEETSDSKDSSEEGDDGSGSGSEVHPPGEEPAVKREKDNPADSKIQFQKHQHPSHQPPPHSQQQQQPPPHLPPHSQHPPPQQFQQHGFQPGFRPGAPPGPGFPPYPHFPPDFSIPPPNFSQPPPNFRDQFPHPPGQPPQFPPRPPVQQFDYGHQRPGEFNRPPLISRDYNHGQPHMMHGGEVEEYDEYEAPRPEPIIPSAMYYELPAGLMAPLVKLSDVDYKPLNPDDLRLPAPQPPSERLLAAVEAFYSPPSHENPRNSDGWEQSGLFEFYKAKLKYIKQRDITPIVPREPVRPREPEKPQRQASPPSTRRSRSRSRSRSRERKRSRSSSVSPRRRSRSPRRRSSSRSVSPRRRRSRSRSKSRSRSRSHSPKRRRSRSRSRSHSPPASFSRRSPTPPSFNPSFMPGPGVKPESRLDESNVGHKLLKKMGWEGSGLGREEQGIVDPIAGGDVRDKFNMYKGVGMDVNDPFDEYRKSKSYTYSRPRNK